jgi:opacity protein-like surface antigen
MRRTLIAAALASLTTLAAGAAMAQMPPPSDIIKAWDKNGDGGVDKSEWMAAGRSESHFAVVDADKDGKISAEELTTAMARMRANRPQGEGGAPPATPAQPKT